MVGERGEGVAAGGREYPAQPIVGVGAVIVVSPADGPLLGGAVHLPEVGVILVRRRFDPLAGQWSLPGGALEAGETLTAGVAREAREETGLAVEVESLVDVAERIVFDADGRLRYHFVLVDYLCQAVGGRLHACSDAAEAVVADAATLAPFELAADTRAVIQRALDMARRRDDRS